MAEKLIKDDYPWTNDHIERAAKIFTADPNLQIAALIIAMIDEHAIQYIEQAPILVLAMIQRANMTLLAEQKKLIKRAEETFKSKPKLDKLLDSYKIPFALRKISGKPLKRDHIDLFFDFKDTNPSILSQSIPQNTDLHGDWIETISQWLSTIKNRMDNNRLANTGGIPHMDWVLTRVGQYLNGEELQLANRSDVASRWMNAIADLMCAHDVEWNDRWSLQAAHDRAIQWHEELARKSNEEKFFSQHGIHWDAPIEFKGPFPKTWDWHTEEETKEGRKKTKVKKHMGHIVPVNSGKDLFLEGKVMHHCVASYADSVVKGKSLIFSVRDLSNNPLTTFELSPRDGGFHLVQQKAHCNHAPSPEIQKAISEYLSLANTGKKGFKVPEEGGE